MELFPLPLHVSLESDRREYADVVYREHVQRKLGVLIDVPPLSVDSYAQRFLPLILTEFNAIEANLKAATLYGIPVAPLPSTETALGSGHYYVFEAPQIREGWPPVTIGDTVLLKQLRWPFKQPQGLCFEARVWSLQRFLGRIIIRCDQLAAYQLVVAENLDRTS